MRRPEFVARQSRCPSGFLGHIVARIMAHETAPDNAAAVELLELASTDQVLEIGFGHGRTITAMASQVPNGFVAGVDPSPVMLQVATRTNRKAIARGLVDLKQGDGRSLPYPSERFDKLLTVHTVYFWKDPVIYFREFRRVLRPDGRLAIGFRPKDELASSTFPPEVYTFRSIEEICDLLREADFTITSISAASVTGHPARVVTAQRSTVMM